MISKDKKKLTLFDKIILVFNVFFATALLCSYSASFVDPAKMWIIALLGIFFTILLFLNLIFVIYWIFRRRAIAIISAIVILAGFNAIRADISIRPYGELNKKSSSKNIRMMAYNVRGFTGYNEDGKKTQNKILQLINDKQPDILNIEEFFVNVNNDKDIFGSLNKSFPAGYHFLKPYEHSQWDTAGLAIYTKYPIRRYDTLAFPGNKQPIQAIYADLNYNDTTIIRVYCVHLQSTRFDEPEHAYLYDLSHHGKIDFHELGLIFHKLKDAFIKRSAEVNLIKNHMKNCPYPYIIAGDFNDTPTSYSANKIGQGLNNAFIEKGSGLGITYYGDFPNIQIDYIMTSKQLEILDYQAVKQKLSDHYPIISDIHLKK